MKKPLLNKREKNCAMFLCWIYTKHRPSSFFLCSMCTQSSRNTLHNHDQQSHWRCDHVWRPPWIIYVTWSTNKSLKNGSKIASLADWYLSRRFFNDRKSLSFFEVRSYHTIQSVKTYDITASYISKYRVMIKFKN